MEHSNWMSEIHVPHTANEIPLGHSRYGGPVIDVPEGFELPSEPMRFAGQLNLAKFAVHDVSGLLPKHGQLYFFADIRTDSGKVIYADVSNQSLQRLVIEHDDNFFLGVLVKEIFQDTETMAEWFMDADGSEMDDANEDGKVWDFGGGIDKSKIFGIYTNSQMVQEEIEAIVNSDKVVLFQVGVDFNDDGVFSVMIPKDDLKEGNFDRCQFNWAQ